MKKTHRLNRRLFLSSLFATPIAIAFWQRQTIKAYLHYPLEDLRRAAPVPVETTDGWYKVKYNPVLGGSLGICFDVAVIKDGDLFRMWFSWRSQKSVALVESKDGIHWGQPVIALAPNQASGWENEINRPVILKRPDGYKMWYTGQSSGQSRIGYAISKDGKTWIRKSNQPVLSPERPWEKTAVMCPSVIWDEKAKLYKMWYSAGDQHEPDAIGYATSPDGQNWSKATVNPIFSPDPKNPWESYKVAACHVIPHAEQYLMFYIGFRDENQAQIGLARSTDGINNWERHPENPIIRPGKTDDDWDYDAVYKPFTLFNNGRWMLWYNGRRDAIEQIGLAIHQGKDLWVNE